jgi:hypothetical protein
MLTLAQRKGVACPCLRSDSTRPCRVRGQAPLRYKTALLNSPDQAQASSFTSPTTPILVTPPTPSLPTPAPRLQPLCGGVRLREPSLMWHRGPLGRCLESILCGIMGLPCMAHLRSSVCCVWGWRADPARSTFKETRVHFWDVSNHLQNNLMASIPGKET